MGELVRWTDDEGVEGVAGIEAAGNPGDGSRRELVGVTVVNLRGRRLCRCRRVRGRGVTALAALYFKDELDVTATYLGQSFRQNDRIMPR